MTKAIMLAGDRIASKPINHDNKAFLAFRGAPLFTHGVRALLGSRNIDRIVVVGPSARLKAALEESETAGTDRCPILIAEQGTNLIENAIIGYLAAIGVEPRGSGEVEDQFDALVDSPHRETPGLFLSCDLPLLTSYEIDEFLLGADMNHFDYAIGLSDESVMAPYRPTSDMPGLDMSCFHLAESRCRHNNLHLGKPLKVTGMHNIERMYELRYQKRFVNILKAFVHLLRTQMKPFAGVRYFSMLQIARSLGERAGGRLYEAVKRRNRLENIVGYIGDALGINVQAVFTRFGGAVLDVDNGDDLAIVDRMYDAWMAHQESIQLEGC